MVLNYSMGNDSFLGQRINAVMGIYDRINGSLIKLTSFPDGFILNNTAGTIQLASTLTDPKIQNISTIITLTNDEKSEKYSNDVRSDLDLRSILPNSLQVSVPTLNEILPHHYRHHYRQLQQRVIEKTKKRALQMTLILIQMKNRK